MCHRSCRFWDLLLLRSPGAVIPNRLHPDCSLTQQPIANLVPSGTAADEARLSLHQFLLHNTLLADVTIAIER